MTVALYFSATPAGEDNPADVGLAQPVGRDHDADYGFLERVIEGGEIKNWVEREYQLVHGGFGDYQHELRGFHLCSERFREALEKARGPRDRLQWLPAWVTSEDGERRRYWVLHFPERPFVIDEDRSVFWNGRIMKGVIDTNKMRDRHVIASPDGSLTSFVVSDTARNVIIDAGCEGLDFEPFPCV